MPLPTAVSEIENNRGTPKPRKQWRIVAIILAVMGAIFLALVAVVALHWPFTEARVLQRLGEDGDSQVQAKSFSPTYFPSPGCALEGVVFIHDPKAAKPLIAIDKLTIRANYATLLASHLTRIVAEGMVITIPPFGSGRPFRTTPTTATIDEIVGNGTKIDFMSDDPSKPPVRFDVHEGVILGAGKAGPLDYRVKVHIPKPPAEIAASGQLGDWNEPNVGETTISGKYELDEGDLGVFEGISGMLSSRGEFEGKLGHIDVSGETRVPDFRVKSGNHPMLLATKFSAYVDGTNGDTFLKRVDANFLKTHVWAQGSVAGLKGKDGKVALIDLKSERARIEDLLRMFVKAERPPMSGTVTFQGRAELPGGPERFLKRINLKGSFGVVDAKFSEATQEGVDKLSAGARGEKDAADPETVLSDLSASESLSGGTARFSEIMFGVPGAKAKLHGTYNLIDEKIDLRGELRVDSKISNTESGTKALLLKMMDPFFKKKKKGEIVPVRISGDYNHPTFGLDLHDKHAQQPTPSAVDRGATKP